MINKSLSNESLLINCATKEQTRVNEILVIHMFDFVGGIKDQKYRQIKIYI